MMTSFCFDPLLHSKVILIPDGYLEEKLES